MNRYTFSSPKPKPIDLSTKVKRHQANKKGMIKVDMELAFKNVSIPVTFLKEDISKDEVFAVNEYVRNFLQSAGGEIKFTKRAK